MVYAIEDLAARLKEARERKGLSQRALSKLAGVPQSHISKIENGTVDLRLSSLVELARALDLELTLVPRKSAVAVNAIIRSGWQREAPQSAASLNELRKLNKRIAALTQEHPSIKELAQLQRQVRDLSRFPIPAKQLRPLREAAERLKNLQGSSKELNGLKSSVRELQSLRNALVHQAPQIEEGVAIRPAYRLEDDDD